jgi:predicted ATP-grasp superfamily ATP-dependent carboligase
VVSEDPNDITFRSRFCAKKVILEKFEASSDGANTSSILSLSQSLNETPVLYWGSDREALFISRNRDKLQAHFRFLLADGKLIEDLTDKARFAALCHIHQLPVPETLTFRSTEEIKQSIHAIPFPCTLKPVFTEDWTSSSLKAKFGTYKHALRRIENSIDLLDYLEALPHTNKGIVLQKFIRGKDDQIFSFHGYFDNAGKLRAGFIGRKIRTNPIEFGGSAYVETAAMPDLISLSVDICERLGYTGIVKIDYKREPGTQKWYLLEFNPRFTLWEQVGAWAGMNIPALWYDDLVGKHPPVMESYRSGMRWLCLAQDLRSFPAYYRSGKWSIGAWVRSYVSPKVYHTFAWNDPWPIMFSFPKFLGRKISRWKLRRVYRRNLAQE